MKNSFLIFSFFLLILSTSFAQSEEIKLQALGNLNLNFPFGDAGKTLETGYGLGLEGRWFYKPNISIGFLAQRYAHSYKGVNFLVSGLYNYKYRMYPVLATAYLYLAPEKKINPYVGGGLGIFYQTASFYVWERAYIKPGFAPAAGLQIAINDELGIDLSARFNITASEAYNIVNGKEVTENQAMVSLAIHAGVYYNLDF